MASCSRPLAMTHLKCDPRTRSRFGTYLRGRARCSRPTARRPTRSRRCGFRAAVAGRWRSGRRCRPRAAASPADTPPAHTAPCPPACSLKHSRRETWFFFSLVASHVVRLNWMRSVWCVPSSERSITFHCNDARHAPDLTSALGVRHVLSDIGRGQQRLTRDPPAAGSGAARRAARTPVGRLVTRETNTRLSWE